ncbi:GuaB3 family IMP dehydrogenase-related protein [Corynebacterium ulceribovis]|uniref:GuaB3 family IMP dehydrogenase-related protein n=1 Tax=Corynebacterium ulceribovis TaxID=487732 RepID=UPI000378D612|nr:GuaB3 family IMP dehydrogenase-related protein [Corynebacterium ulceribovis]
MREMIEFGTGRSARRTWPLSSIGIVPARRARSSRDVDLTWKIDAYSFDAPVLTHPTDAIVSPDMAIEFSKQGGLAVLNGEGLWARHADPEEALARVVAAAEDDVLNYPSSHANAVLQELHKAPIVPELLAERVSQIRESGATTAVRVSPQRAAELTPILVKAGVELLIIQGTLVSADYVQPSGEPLDMGAFIRSVDVPVIVGGVLDYHTALHLMRAGAVGVIVGSGSTAMQETYGIEVGMATAIADVVAARREHLDETGGRYVHVIADGEIDTAGDIARALACGADAVALGAPLAAAKEAPGQGWFWPSSAAHPKYPRGFVSLVEEHAEGAEVQSLEEILHGPSSAAFGTANLIGGLKRAMAKCGFTNVKSFQKVNLSITG